MYNVSQRYHTARYRISKHRRRLISRNKKLKQRYESPEYLTIAFFGLLFGIVLLRLLWLQAFQASKYNEIITNIHYQESLLKATRGDIYVHDKGGNAIPVTKNITLYDIYLEPQYFQPKNSDGNPINPSATQSNKQEFIRLLTPFVYKHLCTQFGVLAVNQEQCVRNIELFASIDILPEKPEFFYTGSGSILDADEQDARESYYTYNRTGYQQSYTEAIDSITAPKAQQIITETLDRLITIGPKESNYVGFFTDTDLLNALRELPFVEVYENYVYIIPGRVTNEGQAISQLRTILTTYQQEDTINLAIKQLTIQENRYVKLLTKVHPDIANQIEALKGEYNTIFYQCQPSNLRRLQERIDNALEDSGTGSTTDLVERQADIDECTEQESMLGDSMTVPFLHGLGLESYDTRYYPYDSFLSHTIGLVNSQGNALYGVEEYMDDRLRGQDGKIIGRSSGVIGSIGANEFDVEEAVDGDDIYLTIDQNIQKYIENILPGYQNRFQSDSISVVVMNPHTGAIKAMSNYPTYNPNNTNNAFRYLPVDPVQARIVDREDYIDVHLFVQDAEGSMRKATTEERTDPTIRKRIAENTYGSEVFVDKTIKYAYEPGSVFKPLTVAIALDSDEIELYDFYNDRGEAKIDIGNGVEFVIRNVSSSCLGDHSYLNALTFSCNVGMINIIRQIGKPIFYNYLTKLGFGEKTNIELGGEEQGFIGTANTVSMSRFFNNSFGLGLRATPIQLAQAFSTVLNGGNLIKPTVIHQIYDQEKQEYIINEPEVLRRVFRQEAADQVREALFDIVEGNPETRDNVRLEGFSLGGKTGTAEIVYKGRYRGSDGWTNASFIGVVTEKNPEYIIVVQIRRPRWKRWGTYTAGPLFKDIAGFLIAYDLMQE